MHLDRPLDHRLGDRHQRIIEQRLGQAVADLLLAGGQDHRRAGELGAVERAHGVAEAGRDMDVAGDQFTRRARIAVRHRDHDRLLQPEHIGQVLVILERIHDGQLRRARITEQMRDAFVLEQGEKCRASGNRVDRHDRSLGFHRLMIAQEVMGRRGQRSIKQVMKRA